MRNKVKGKGGYIYCDCDKKIMKKVAYKNQENANYGRSYVGCSGYFVKDEDPVAFGKCGIYAFEPEMGEIKTKKCEYYKCRKPLHLAAVDEELISKASSYIRQTYNPGQYELYFACPGMDYKGYIRP